MSTPSILDDLKKFEDEYLRYVKLNPPLYFPPVTFSPIPKETTMIKTETKTVTTKTLGSFTLEIHQDGSAAIKGLWDQDGKRIETQRFSKEYLKNLYKLLGEVVVG